MIITDITGSVIDTMVRQIGRMTILGVSGGRIRRIDETTISLPIGRGYSVEVTYDRGFDGYSVRRVFTRGPKRWVKGEVDHVYFDTLSDTVYDASCFVNVAFGDHDPRV